MDKSEEEYEVQYAYRAYETCRIPKSIVDRGDDAMIEYIRAEIDDAPDVEIMGY
jgi:hypothetical protein